MGVQPAEHLAACGLEPNNLPALVISGEGFAEGPELGGVHHIDVELAVDIMTEEELVAMGVAEVGVKALRHIVAQLLVDQSGLAGLDRGTNLRDIGGLVIGPVAILAGVEAHMILDHDFDEVPMVAPVLAVVEGIRGAFVRGVEGVGERDGIDLLFHGDDLLCFTMVIIPPPYPAVNPQNA